ncbi:ABC transporter I member 19 [Ancistrocladus abbreviatus]
MAGRGDDDQSSTIRVRAMQFAYDGQRPLFVDFNLDISPGSRCLLVGANGSGKTTLLKILAGKHMVGGRDVVRVLNCSAFHDTQLVCSGDLSYLGGSWSKTVASAGEVPLQGDVSAETMIFGERRFQAYINVTGSEICSMPIWVAICSMNQLPSPLAVEGIDPDRREKLIELLDIDLQWRMHKVSDGQRRRVQICMGLLHPFKVLLLDEVTVDLDVVARLDLLDFFKEECAKRGATIVYATHIFDGLETWATDLAYIQDGELRRKEKLSELQELRSSTNLLSVVECWLRSETKLEKERPMNSAIHVQKSSPFDTSPFRSSRHMAYYR